MNSQFLAEEQAPYGIMGVSLSKTNVKLNVEDKISLTHTIYKNCNEYCNKIVKKGIFRVQSHWNIIFTRALLILEGVIFSFYIYNNF